ncbi:N-acetylglucosamine-specific PTS transporter subunit IIBC [Geosporobacter ferrireducens]|uniref:N-acetylglucosamine-specific PTS transporter subunit IIBC n=1 Tax=Geosporobacter ferrireducens TaxID=1424294 RepID=UPI00139CE5AE|nr:N-acetylglucosamine-specific PTS transporter subunit IIBC [Geosporobacter ferrireducens]MTI53543.1 PTS sugar transporter [Geosporobacter ferrireducens]
MSKNGFARLSKLGKALMLPIAVLPAAGLLLRLGAPDVLNIPFVMEAGGAVFSNLALLFAIGIAVGLAHDNNGAAGIAGMVGYFVLVNGLKTINPDLNMSVLAGILVGALAGGLYNKFYNIQLPEFLGFFGGKRFVPIVTAGACIVLAGIFGIIWAPIQNGIHAIGEWIIGAGVVGVFAFGFFNRLLIPVGLHHVLNSFIWFVFGEYSDAAGKVATGDLGRFFAGDPTAGNFMAGFFIIFMFALPAAALAMYKCAKPENRKALGGALVSVAFTAFLTGITEPIEFMFLFLAPMLYFFHAIFTGLALVVSYMLGSLHGFTFSAGMIDFALNWGLATKPILIIPAGLVFAALYYFVFVWAINKFDILTPGRLDEETGESFENVSEAAVLLVETLGGAENIESLDACITRLRLTVKNPDIIEENSLKAIGAKGMIKKGNMLQVIVGTKAELIADEMKKAIKKVKA